MADRENLLAKVANAPRSTDMATLIQLMKAWDFDPEATSSNHNVLFWHRVYDIPPASAGRPHHGPVLVKYIKRCLAAIEEVQIREAKTDG